MIMALPRSKDEQCPATGVIFRHANFLMQTDLVTFLSDYGRR